MDVTLLLNTSQRSNCLKTNERSDRSSATRGVGDSPPTHFLPASPQTSALKSIAGPRRCHGRALDSHSVPRTLNTSFHMDSIQQRHSFSEQKDASPVYEISSEVSMLASPISPVHEKHLIRDVMLSLSSPAHAYAKSNLSPVGSTKSENDISSELGRRGFGRFGKTHAEHHDHFTRKMSTAFSRESPTRDLGASGIKSSESLESLSRRRLPSTSPNTDLATCDKATVGSAGNDTRNDPKLAVAGGGPFFGSFRRFARPKMRRRATSAPDFAPSTKLTKSNMAHSPKSLMSIATGGLEQGKRAVDASPDSSLSWLSPEPRSRPQSESPLPAGSPISTIREAHLGDEESLAQAEMQDGPWEEPCCMFVKDCNTGSQLRKAISHLFGRNKSCTLRIPKKVWVYYCRKHYQRVRYRNAKTYPLNQMELVRLQIRRLQSWSVENQRTGSGPFIKNWTLSLRKREQNRLDQSASADNADDEENQAGPPAPEWLLQRLGSGYTTEQMMDVAKRLHDEIRDAILGQVPEIEFLPDIVDPEEGVPSKPGRVRKQSRPSPEYRPLKRKASSKLSDIRPNTQSTASFWRHHDLAVDVSGKRMRTEAAGHPFRPEHAAAGASSESYASFSGTSHADNYHAATPILPGVDYLDHGQGHSMFMHSRAEGLTSPYDQDQPTSASSSHRHPGHESPQAGFQWTTRRGGHIRLPSINAQLPLQESKYSISPARPFLRGSDPSPIDQDRSRPAHHHHQRSNTSTTVFPPFHRPDQSPAWVRAEYASPSIPREPWHQQERGFAPSWQSDYHRVNAAPPAQHHQHQHQHHFQRGPRHEEHPSPYSEYTWRPHQPDARDDASYIPGGRPRDAQMSDEAKRCSIHPSLQ